MLSDEDNVECENDRTNLLSQNSNEPTRKLHGEVGKFLYPHSDGENNQDDIALREINDNGELSPHKKVSRPSLFSKIPKRYIILVLTSLGSFNMYCIRMCLNVTIVSMTRNEGEQINSSGIHIAKEPEFNWNKQFQGTILASLYWSYTALQIPAGLLCVKYGGSFLLGMSIFGSSVLTLATPFVVRQNVYAFIFLRILEGGFLGMVAASGITLVSKWSPVYERSIFLTVVSSGYLFGTVFANSLSGVLCGSSWGWPSVFYFFGVQGILWYLCWLYFVYEDPTDHPTIKKAELELIGKHWDSKLSFKDIPWTYILTSLQVWAIVVSSFTDCWSFYTFMLSFPGYLKDVQNLNITTIGFTSSLPYVFAGICTPAWGYFIDVLRSKNYISTTNSRKLSAVVGSGVSGIFVISMPYASSVAAAITIITIAITLEGFTTSGPSTNMVDLAPKYCGILMGIVNFACNITGFIAPEVVGALTVHGDPRQQWSLVFYIAAASNALGMIFYCCFASSKKQAWAEH